VSQPLLAVVVPTFRSAGVLPGLLESLAAQRFRGFEVVLSDGASEDGTLALARAAAPKLPALVVDTRPDQGVYDAINRGVRLSSAPWFLVLGSDDRLHATDTLAQAAAVLQALPDPVSDLEASEFVYGDVRMMAANLHGVAAGERYAGPVPFAQLASSNICQQAIFYRRSLFDALGGFDLRYPLYADWAFNLQASFRRPMQWIDLVVADYASTGMSTARFDKRFIAERPSLVRQGFVEHGDKPWVRAGRKRLLRDANWLRRHGRWAEALQNLKVWFDLLPLPPRGRGQG
jgi:glycosyltransferase involved in cell wall biosynthesis